MILETPFHPDSLMPPLGGGGGGGGGPFTADSIALALGQEGLGARPPTTPLERMRADPTLVSLIAMARQNPALVQPLLEELSRSNPPLLRLIQESQADFMALLNGTEPLPTPAAPQAAAPPPAAPVAGGQGPPPGAVQIRVTPEEREAIERLCAMTGMPRDAVLQAYIACDKDENLAANLLFDG